MLTNHVVNYLRAMRGMMPIQRFQTGGVTQPFGGWNPPPPPIQPINDFNQQPFIPQMNPYNTFPIGKSNPTFPIGFPPPLMPGQNFQRGNNRRIDQGGFPVDQPHPGQFQPVTGPLPPTPFVPFSGGLPPAPSNLGVPANTPGTGLNRSSIQIPSDPNNNPALLDPNSQAGLMYSKFGKGPALQGYAYGGVVKKKKGKKMRKVPGRYEPDDPNLPTELDPNSLKGWASNAGAGQV